MKRIPISSRAYVPSISPLNRTLLTRLQFIGLAKPNTLIASVHPADKLSLQSFQSLGVETVVKNEPVVQQSDVVFVSVKPQVVPAVLSEIQPLSAGKLFLSVAMGITLSTIESSLSPQARVIRVMPNLPAVVCSGCSVFVRGSKATDADAEVTEKAQCVRA